MRCSRCSQPVRPVVAIDLDGTIAEYHRHFIELTGMYVGRSMLPSMPFYEGGPEGSWREWIKQAFEINDATYESIKLAYRQGSWKRWQAPYVGVHYLWEILFMIRAEVWITTTRPYLRHDSVDPDTRFWLEMHNLPYYGLLYDDEKYHALADRVDKERVIAVVDGLPEQYDAAAEVFGAKVPILRRNGWNRGVEKPNTLDGLHDIAIEIKNRNREWEREAVADV